MWGLHYRETLVVVDMGRVDFNYGHSTVSVVPLRQMAIWQNRPTIWVKMT